MTDQIKRKLIVCSGTACISPGGKRLEPEIKRLLSKYKATDLVSVEEAVSYGECGRCPMVIIEPEGTYYEKVDSEKLERIISEHIVGGNVVLDLQSKDHIDSKNVRVLGGEAFFDKQRRIALRNCGVIDPDSLDDYLQMKGYESLARVLENMTPDEVIVEIEKSGLRGRGGGGYPTGLKWR